ncbi:phage scaffolding protein [Clostridium botulinum]|uniref:phage scaffolding protein n=1 Tax=Clostridium botulinum TaxID=1491 RepID=UPI0004D99F7C|nr:phage scaffolding protein [Clostridium botulinum]KEH93229.1 scaffolding protein [Clostridium botulinum C/D str. It1]
MGIKELLKKLGYSDEDITKIENGMKENKIYTTSEENMDIRYSKLKEQKEDLETELKTANSTIKDLKKNNTDNEELQTKVSNYEKEIATLKETTAKREKEFTIKSKLKDAGCTDVDYMLYKLGDINKLDIEKDLDNKVKELTENNTSFFKNDTTKEGNQDPKIIANKLTDGTPGSETDSIATTFANALNGNI